MGDAPAAVLALPDLGEALIGLERVTAGRNEIDRGVEVRTGEIGVRRSAAHLGIELVGEERLATGAAQHMLCQHVERADARGRRVLRLGGNGVERGGAFQHLKTVRGDQDAARRLIHAVIGAAVPGTAGTGSVPRTGAQPQQYQPQQQYDDRRGGGMYAIIGFLALIAVVVGGIVLFNVLSKDDEPSEFPMPAVVGALLEDGNQVLTDAGLQVNPPVIGNDRVQQYYVVAGPENDIAPGPKVPILV